MFEWFKKNQVEPEVQVKSFTPKVLFEGSPMFLSLLNCSGSLSGYKNKVVYSVTNALVNKLLEVPILLTKDRSVKQANAFRKSKAINPERLYMAKALGLEEIDNHDLLDLLEKPNEYQTCAEFLRAFWFNKLLTKAGIIYVEKSGDLSRKSGKPIALHVLPTSKVTITESADWKNPVTNYRFISSTGQDIPIDPKYILYSGNWNPDSMFEGYDPFKSIGSTVDKNNVNDLAQLAAFKNGGTGILFSSDTVTDGVGGVSDKMTPEMMETLKQKITQEYAGAANNKRMHFTNGFVNVTSFGDTLADLKMIEASADDVKGICAFFGISPIIIGEGAANTESNVVQAFKSLVTNNVVPKLREFDQAFNKFSKDWYKDRVRVCHDITEFAELMPNMELVQKVYGNNPAVKLNELRLMLGLDWIDDPLFNQSYIQAGFVPLQDAGFTNAYNQPTGNG